jgi:hypothetical protein
MKAVEDGKQKREYLLKQLPLFLGAALVVGFASVVIYRYVGSG